MKPSNTLKFMVIILVTILNLLPGTPYAQPHSLYQGDTIRTTAPNYIYGRIGGELVDLRNDSLQVQVYKRDLFIPLHQITKLEVARGKKRNAKKGFIIGALGGGLGLGSILAVAAYNDEQEGRWTLSPEQAFMYAFFEGSLLGGLAGAIIGSGIESTRWVKVPLEGLSVAEKAAAPPPRPTTRGRKLHGRQRALNRSWRLSATLGTTSSGPAGDIEDAMRRDGWDETLPGGWFGGPVDHPFSNTGFGEIGAPWSIQVSYSLSQRFDAALLVSHNPIGSTDGYRTGPESYLFLNFYSITISPILLYRSPGIVQLGIGPAWFINKIEQEEVDKIIYREQKGRPGMVVQAILLYPQHTRFFVKLDVQYRWTPKTTFGPFKDTYRGISLAELHPSQVNFSHLFVGFGIGIHF